MAAPPREEWIVPGEFHRIEQYAEQVPGMPGEHAMIRVVTTARSHHKRRNLWTLQDTIEHPNLATAWIKARQRAQLVMAVACAHRPTTLDALLAPLARRETADQMTMFDEEQLY